MGDCVAVFVELSSFSASNAAIQSSVSRVLQCFEHTPFFWDMHELQTLKGASASNELSFGIAVFGCLLGFRVFGVGVLRM